MQSIDSSSDEQLLAAHVDGDPHAFAELFRRHSDRLWAVALRTCRDPDDAADSLQDAMVSAFRRASSFRGDARVTTWLHRIVVNACLDRMRSRKNRPTIALPETEPDVGTHDGRDQISEHVTRMTVMTALAELPDEQRIALTLVDLEGWPVDEAAEILQIPPGTVKSRCFRGRQRMAELLRNHSEAGDVPTKSSRITDGVNDDNE